MAITITRPSLSSSRPTQPRDVLPPPPPRASAAMSSSALPPAGASLALASPAPSTAVASDPRRPPPSSSPKVSVVRRTRRKKPASSAENRSYAPCHFARTEETTANRRSASRGDREEGGLGRRAGEAASAPSAETKRAQVSFRPPFPRSPRLRRSTTTMRAPRVRRGDSMRRLDRSRRSGTEEEEEEEASDFERASGGRILVLKNTPSWAGAAAVIRWSSG